jgi:hypothetical protein
MADKYCKYIAKEENKKLDPAIDLGDTICVDCPSDGKCPEGPTISLKDKKGNTATLKVGRVDSECRDCPKDAKKGYEFDGSKKSGSGHGTRRG